MSAEIILNPKSRKMERERSQTKSFEAPFGPCSIRPLEMSDYKEVKNIYYDTFDLCDDADFFRAWKFRNRQSSLGLFYKSTLIGFGLVEGTKLWFLAVAPSCRGGGTGSALLRAIMDTMDSCFLTPVNVPTIMAWYERNGFRVSRYYDSKDTKSPATMMCYHRYNTRARSF